MPEYSKDVAVAILGASIALAGLLLVAAGFVLAIIAGSPASTSNARLRSYEKAARWSLLPCVLALADAALCLRWLLCASPGLYQALTATFFAVLLLTAVYAAVLLLKVL